MAKTDTRSQKIRRLIPTLAVCLWLAGPARAARIHPQAGSTAATFLKIAPGARAAAMGEAFGALADDASALYWNPAGILQLRHKEFTAMHDESFQDIRYGFVGYAQPWGERRAWGVSASGLFLQNDLERRSGVGESVPETPLTPSEGTFGADDTSLAVSGAFYPWRALAFGATLKGIRQRIDDEKAAGAALDLGALYQIPKKPVRVALAFQNIGPGMRFVQRHYKLPFNVKVGGAWQAHPKVDVTLDVNQPIDNYTRFHTGLEYRIFRFFALRAGYKYRLHGNELGEVSGLTAGSGFRFGAAGLDYAFNPAGDLGDTHRLSFTLRFGENPARTPAAVPRKAEQVPAEMEPPREEKIAFRLKLTSLPAATAESPSHRVEAEANTPADLYHLTFQTVVRSTGSARLESVESPVMDEFPVPAGPVYKMISFHHTFPGGLRKMDAAFRVKKSWLKAVAVAAADVRLARVEGPRRFLKPTRITGENDDYVSFAASMDREGTLAILARPKPLKK
ncbi:MAG TPA: PorV/PorQ family protein [Elusimicrobiota bacterium]|nr:PorV/PorQ family protein [Elusimicrobiota bacterium]